MRDMEVPTQCLAPRALCKWQGAERGVGGRTQREAQGVGWAVKGPGGPGLSSWLCHWPAGRLSVCVLLIPFVWAVGGPR